VAAAAGARGRKKMEGCFRRLPSSGEGAGKTTEGSAASSTPGEEEARRRGLKREEGREVERERERGLGVEFFYFSS